MRKILSLLLAAALLLLALAGCSQAQEEEPLPESIEINFFYNEPCGACHDQINDFYDMFNTQLEDVKDKYPYNLQAYNVFQASASDKMYTVLEGLGYPEELISSLTYPILTINGKAYLGTDSIQESLREAFLTAGEDLFENGRGVYDPLEERTVAQQLEDYPLEKGSATAVYFYRLTCEECIQTEEEGLPAGAGGGGRQELSPASGAHQHTLGQQQRNPPGLFRGVPGAGGGPDGAHCLHLPGLPGGV